MAHKIYGQNVTIISSGGDQPQLNPPAISIAGTTLSIEDPATNGNFTSGWKLYDNGAYVDQFLTAVVQLANIQFSTGTHKLTVKSFGTNFKDSAASNEVTYQITEKLATPVVSISSSIINWELIPNASGYLISYTGTASGTQSVSVGTSSYDLEGLLSTSGTYIVTVTAKGTGDYTDSDPSNAVTYINQEQLATPQNVTANGTTVSWDEVENATSYEIYADGVSIGTVENESGETWLINDNAFAQSVYNNKTYTALFNSNGQTFNSIIINNNPMNGGMFYDSTKVVDPDHASTFINQAYRTVTFETAPSGELLTWLQANATKQ